MTDAFANMMSEMFGDDPEPIEPEDVFDLKTATMAELMEIRNYLAEALALLGEAFTQTSQEGREMHSRRGAIVVEINKRFKLEQGK